MTLCCRQEVLRAAGRPAQHPGGDTEDPQAPSGALGAGPVRICSQPAPAQRREAQVSSDRAKGSPGRAAGEDRLCPGHPQGLCHCSWPAFGGVEEQPWLWARPHLGQAHWLSWVLLTAGCALCPAMKDLSAALRAAPTSAVSAAELCPAASSALGVLEFSRALFHLQAFPESQNC